MWLKYNISIFGYSVSLLILTAHMGIILLFTSLFEKLCFKFQIIILQKNSFGTLTFPKLIIEHF
jgi:hypothetical protein